MIEISPGTLMPRLLSEVAGDPEMHALWEVAVEETRLGIPLFFGCCGQVSRRYHTFAEHQGGAIDDFSLHRLDAAFAAGGHLCFDASPAASAPGATAAQRAQG